MIAPFVEPRPQTSSQSLNSHPLSHDADNPAAWYAVIKCGCADVFQAAYPQCVDCFVQTNQCEEFLGVPSDSGASSM